MNQKNKEFFEEFQRWSNYILDKIEDCYYQEVKKSIESKTKELKTLLEKEK